MLDIVIAYYQNRNFENLIYKFEDANIVIYDKSGKYLNSKYMNVTVLENRGREGDTYLTHIINNYDKLEEYTLFIQDDTENHIPDYDDFVKETNNTIHSKNTFLQHYTLWRKNVQLLPNLIINGYNKLYDECWLNNESNVNNIIKLYKDNILTENDYNILESYRKKQPHKFAIKHACEKFNITLPESYFSQHSAFFIVHKSQIHKRTKEFYIELRNWILEDEMNAFVLEMIWILIFGE